MSASAATPAAILRVAVGPASDAGSVFLRRTIGTRACAPFGDALKQHQSENFRNWQLVVEGMIERPSALSVDQLKTHSSYNQITETVCEEGWSYIAEWNGVRLSHVLDLVGVHPEAKYVFYFSIEPDWWESMDKADALHPQTFITYGMNGDELPVGYGGPVRMKLPRQLGYQSDSCHGQCEKVGKGLGSISPEQGHAWYAGI